MASALLGLKKDLAALKIDTTAASDAVLKDEQTALKMADVQMKVSQLQLKMAKETDATKIAALQTTEMDPLQTELYTLQSATWGLFEEQSFKTTVGKWKEGMTGQAEKEITMLRSGALWSALDKAE